MPEIETPEVLEPSKPSKLERVKSVAVNVGIFVIPTAIVAGSIVASVKMGKMQLETAKLNLEAAKLNKL